LTLLSEGLPSETFGRLTETVGLFRCPIDRMPWVMGGTPKGEPVPVVFRAFEDVAAALVPGTGPRRRSLFFPWSDWTLLLTDGPLGTDVGLSPSLAADEFGIFSLRAAASAERGVSS